MEADVERTRRHCWYKEKECGVRKRIDYLLTIKPVFNDQIHIDLIKFANKFEAAYEIIKKWYLKEKDNAYEERN